MWEAETTGELFFHHAPIGLALLSPEGDLIKTNSSFLEIFGYNLAEVLELNFGDLVHPTDQAEFKSLLESLIHTERHKNVHIRYVCKDERIIWANSLFFRVAAKGGSHSHLMVMVEDISERVRAEERVRFQARMLSSINDAVIATDTDFNIRYWNGVAGEIYGWKREEVLGKSAIELLLKDIPEEERKQVLEPLASEGEFKGEVETVQRDGSRNTVEVSVRGVHDDRGNLIGYIGIFRDITEKLRLQKEEQESKQLYKSTFTAIKDALLIVETGTRTIRECNKAVEDVFGYSRKEVLGRNTEFLHVDRNSYEHFGLVSEKNLQEKGDFQSLFQMRRKDGTIIDTEHSIVKITDESGNRLGAVSIVRDISEQVRHETEILEKAEQLRSLALHLETVREEERKYIAREIHDQLGQELAALKMSISAFGSSISKQKEFPVKTDMLRMLDDSHAILASAFRSIRRLVTEIRPEIIDHHGLVAAIRWQLEEFARRTGIESLLETRSEEISVGKEGDIALFRLVQEALTNISKHAAASAVKVEMSQSEKGLRMVISDNGKGFVVKPVEQLQTFGLLGMKERTTALGGSMEIQSEPGKGTALLFQIPVAGA